MLKFLVVKPMHSLPYSKLLSQFPKKQITGIQPFFGLFSIHGKPIKIPKSIGCYLNHIGVTKP